MISLLPSELVITVCSVVSNLTLKLVQTQMSLSPEAALPRVAPELRPLLSHVVRHGRVGLDSSNCLRVTDIKTGYTSVPFSFLA
uniref:Secreted protein n=1 Tax=Knipowitschia caucasica TaxID=637954 RepID=A0AAV2JGJ4_KNICA